MCFAANELTDELSRTRAIHIRHPPAPLKGGVVVVTVKPPRGSRGVIEGIACDSENRFVFGLDKEGF